MWAMIRTLSARHLSWETTRLHAANAANAWSERLRERLRLFSHLPGRSMHVRIAPLRSGIGHHRSLKSGRRYRADRDGSPADRGSFSVRPARRVLCDSTFHPHRLIDGWTFDFVGSSRHQCGGRFAAGPIPGRCAASFPRFERTRRPMGSNSGRPRQNRHRTGNRDHESAGVHSIRSNRRTDGWPLLADCDSAAAAPATGARVHEFPESRPNGAGLPEAKTRPPHSLGRSRSSRLRIGARSRASPPPATSPFSRPPAA